MPTSGYKPRDHTPYFERLIDKFGSRPWARRAPPPKHKVEPPIFCYSFSEGIRDKIMVAIKSRYSTPLESDRTRLEMAKQRAMEEPAEWYDLVNWDS